MKGILIIALGNPFYGRYAYNLMQSLKNTSKLPICLAYGGNAKRHISMFPKIWDKEVVVDPKFYTDKNGQENFIRAKMYMNKITPFKETIFIDADVVMTPLKSIDDIVFKHDIQFQCRGISKMDANHYWVNLKEVEKEYGMKQYYNLFSEFVYFKSTNAVNKIFTKAQKIYDNLKISHRVFNGTIPDEVPFSIAMDNVEMNSFFVPIYWEHAELKRMSGRELNANYYGYSHGGNRPETYMTKTYMNYALYHGNNYTWKPLAKAMWNPKRGNI